MAALTISATATDSTGATATAQASATVTDPAPQPAVVGNSMNQTIGGTGQTWAQARAVYDGNYADATHKPAHRSYIAGTPSAGNWGNVIPLDRSAVVSFKVASIAGVPDLDGILAGGYDTPYTAFFQACPTTRATPDRRYWWTFFHEMENDFDTPAAMAKYVQAFRYLVALQQRVAPNAIADWCVIYMDFTLAPTAKNPDGSRRNWLDWYPGDDVVDGIFWDQYAYDNGDGTLNPESVKQANRPSAATSHSHGKAYGVGEFPISGAPVNATPTIPDATRTQWMAATVAAMKANGAVVVMAFDTNVGGQFAIEANPTLVAAWRSIVTGS